MSHKISKFFDLYNLSNIGSKLTPTKSNIKLNVKEIPKQSSIEPSPIESVPLKQPSIEPSPIESVPLKQPSIEPSPVKSTPINQPSIIKPQYVDTNLDTKVISIFNGKFNNIINYAILLLLIIIISIFIYLYRKQIKNGIDYIINFFNKTKPNTPKQYNKEYEKKEKKEEKKEKKEEKLERKNKDYCVIGKNNEGKLICVPNYKHRDCRSNKYVTINDCANL